MRPHWSLDSIKTNLKQLRRGAPDASAEKAANDGDLIPLDFPSWPAWETAFGDHQIMSQLEFLSMVVRTMSDLDSIVAEKACTIGFILRFLACVRARIM